MTAGEEGVLKAGPKPGPITRLNPGRIEPRGPPGPRIRRIKPKDRPGLLIRPPRPRKSRRPRKSNDYLLLQTQTRAGVIACLFCLREVPARQNPETPAGGCSPVLERAIEAICARLWREDHDFFFALDPFEKPLRLLRSHLEHLRLLGDSVLLFFVVLFPPLRLLPLLLRIAFLLLVGF